MKRGMLLGLLLAGTLPLVAATTGADEPSPTTHASPIVPDPRECLVMPRTEDEVVHLIGTPPLGHDAGGPRELPTEIPVGPPADHDVVVALIATERMLLACRNAGDSLRHLALYSDEYLRSIGPQDPSALRDLATPSPAPPAERVSLLGVWDARSLGEGRVGAFVAIGNVVDPESSPGQTFFVVFALEGDRWLVDDMFDETVSGPVAELAGTPPPTE